MYEYDDEVLVHIFKVNRHSFLVKRSQILRRLQRNF